MAWGFVVEIRHSHKFVSFLITCSVIKVNLIRGTYWNKFSIKLCNLVGMLSDSDNFLP